MTRFVLRFFLGLLQFIVLLALSAGMFYLCIELYTRNNSFSVMYHPDEWTKADQLISNGRNFNHPLLMLEAAQLVIEREQVSNDTASVVFAGRRTSAYLAALAAVFMAWAGWFSARWTGFILAGIGAGLCPALLSHAHYFKEDTSLCCGVAAVVCVAAAMSTRRHWLIMLFLSLLLGSACGLAASGKYAGAVMAVPAVLIVLMATFNRWLIMPLCLLLIAGGAYWSWTMINYRAMQEWQAFQAGFNAESQHAVTEHYGVTMGRPNLYFVDAVWSDSMPHVKIMLIVAPVLLLMIGIERWWNRRRVIISAKATAMNDAPDMGAIPVAIAVPKERYTSLMFGWWLLITIVIYTAALSWSVIPFYRYAIPSTLMVYTLAAIAVAWLIRVLARPWWMRMSLLTIMTLTVLAVQWARCIDYNDQFGNDSRDQLPLWIANTLTGTPRIAADGYTELGASGSYNGPNVQPQVMRYRFAAEGGTAESLRGMGIQYVVIASSSYDRWTSPYTSGSPGFEAEHRRNAQFYRDLFDNYPAVAQWKARNPMRTFTNPDITVFRIDQGPSRTP